MNNTKFSWGHLFATLAGVVVTIVTPSVQHFIGQHEYLGTVLVGAWSILGLFLNRPTGN